MSRRQKGANTTRPGRSLRDHVARWRKLIAAARRHELELPALGPFLAALEEAFDEVVATSNRRQSLKNLYRESGRELKAQSASCAEMAARLKSLVRASFGRKDDRLPEFGINLPGGLRKPKQAEGGKTAPPVTTDGGCP